MNTSPTFPSCPTCPDALPDMTTLSAYELRGIRAACDSFDIIARVLADGFELAASLFNDQYHFTLAVGGLRLPTEASGPDIYDALQKLEQRLTQLKEATR